MSITATERTQIVELTTLMFNAAPGATYLSEIVSIYEANGRSLSTLANLLAGTGVYNTVFPNTMTSGEFAAKFLATVGLSTDAFALDWVASKLNAGMSRGEVVFAAFNALNNVISTDPAQYQAAKAMLLNKTAVSEFYSDPAPTGIAGTATDLVTLQNVVAGVTDDSSTVATAEAALTSAVNANLVLKPGADNISSGTNVIGDLSPFFFNGVGPTLNSTDAISNVQNLTITDQFGTGVDIIPAGVTLSNIQNVSLQTAGNAGGAGQAFDTSGISGVTTLTVNSSGAAGDFVTAAATTDITMSQTNQADATVFITGGNNVTLTAAGAGGSIIGSAVNAAAVPPTAQLPAGNVTVTDTSTSALAAAGVKVYGGKAVTVSVTSLTNGGVIAIGNTAGNTGNIAAGGIVNPTGAVKVTSVANVAPGAMTIFGGTTVDVTAAGNTITVGDVGAKVASNQASGAITISDQQPTTYDNLKGSGHTQTKGGLVSVFGGTNVAVSTNTGSGVVIGADGKAATMPTGAITVVDSASNLNGAFGFAGAGWPADLIMGGTSVDVTAAGGTVFIGSGAAGTTKAIDNPTGAVTVTETAASHQGVVVDGGSSTTVNAQGQGVFLGFFDGVAGAQVVNQASPFTGNALGSTNAASNVVVNGGTTVTVNTTGGNTFVGNNAVANGTRQVASDNVTVNNTFSGADTANGSVTTVLGGKAVNITYANGTSGAITVGAAAVLDSTGTALTNGALDASGDVTIVNGSGAALGTGAVSVMTNGAANVSVTGATGAAITDVQTTLATGGPNVGKAIGTSTLTNVSLTSVAGASAVNSDAIKSLSISDSTAAAPSVVTVNSASSHSLALTLNNDAAGTTLNDARATAVTVTTAGSAKDNIILNTGAAKSFTFSNAQALTVGAGTAMSATGPDTVVANGAGALNLGDTTAWGGAAKLASIDASAATGAVTATISGDNTTFKGGAGNDSVKVNESFQLAKSIDGGAGTDTVTLTNVATIYNPLLNPTGPIFADFANFEILGLAAGTNGTYDVSGFQGVTVSATAGALNLINAAAAEMLTFTGAAAGGTTWVSGATANVTIGVDGKTAAGVNAGGLATGTGTAGAATVNVAAVGAAGMTGNHALALHDNFAATKTLNISGDAKLTLTDNDATIRTLKVTDTAAVTVNGTFAAAAGVNVTGGAGKLTVSLLNSAPNTNQVDVLTSGSGGVVATIGAGNAVGGGSETINLTASSAVRDTLTANTNPTAGNGTRAVINGFGLGQSGAIAAGDVITFEAAKTIAANTAAPVAGASGSTYAISNGIVTLVTPIGGLTGLVELADVQGIIDATANTVGAVTIAGTTYVIASDGVVGTAAEDTVLQLSNVSGVTGFGQSAVGTLQMGAGSTIMSTNIGLINAGNTGSAVANTTFADLGFAWDTLSSSAAGITNTYQNLGNWAELDVTGVAAGNAVVTQVGTAPKELYVKATGAFTLDSLTVDGAVVLDTVGGAATIKSLVAGSSTIWVTGANNATISAITDAALTTVDASNATGLVKVGGGTSGITNAGVTFKGGTGGLNVTASGAGDTIIGSNAAAVGAHTILANGNGDTITLGGGVNTVTANGTNDTITVGALAVGAAIANVQTIHASGVGSTITFSTAGDDGNPTTWTGASTIDGGVGVGVYTVGIGNNSTVNFGNNGAGGSQNVVVTGNFTGTTADGAFSFVTLGNVVSGAGDMVTFNNVGGDGTTVLGEAWLGQVNVASATSLADALNLAASVAALSQQAGGANTAAGSMFANTGLIDWFQYGGDTYIVEAINGTANAATHTALGAGDQVIKIVGLVDLSGAVFAGHTVTL